MPKPDCPRIYVGDFRKGYLEVKAFRRQNNPQKRFEVDVLAEHRELSRSEKWVRNQATQLGRNLHNQNFVIASLTFEVSEGSLYDDSHRCVPITIPIKVPGKDYYNFNNASLDIRLDRKSKGLPINPQKIHAENYELIEEINSTGNALVLTRPLRLHRSSYRKEHVCGHHPKYGNPKHDQFVRHSETVLYGYLSTRKAAMTLVNYLTSRLRQNDRHTIGSTIKVYSVILHIQSTNNPCGPCERSTVGIQHSHYHTNNQVKKFLELLADELSSRRIESTDGQPPSPFQFTYPGCNKNRAPKKKGIKMFTSYLGNYRDNDHRKYTHKKGSTNKIDMDESSSRRSIFVVNRALKWSDSQLNSYGAYVGDYTVFASSSNSHPATSEAVASIQETRDEFEYSPVKFVHRLFK